MSDNPYRTPQTTDNDSLAAAHTTVKAMSKRQLTCPSCGEPTISARKAAVFYPTLKVRCTACHDRIRITLPKAERRQFNLIWLAAVFTAVLALVLLLLWPEPFDDLEDLASRFLPGLWTSIGRSLGRYSQPIIVGCILLSLFLVPILLMTRLALQSTLRLILTAATLTGTAKVQSGTAKAEAGTINVKDHD